MGNPWLLKLRSLSWARTAALHILLAWQFIQLGCNDSLWIWQVHTCKSYRKLKLWILLNISLSKVTVYIIESLHTRLSHGCSQPSLVWGFFTCGQYAWYLATCTPKPLRGSPRKLRPPERGLLRQFSSLIRRHGSTLSSLCTLRCIAPLIIYHLNRCFKLIFIQMSYPCTLACVLSRTEPTKRSLSMVGKRV